MNQDILFGFLLEIGKWAKIELGERWKLKRSSDASKSSVDLSDYKEDENMVIHYRQWLTVDDIQFKNIESIINKTKDLIYEWRLEILEIEDQINKRLIDVSAARRRQSELEDKIKQQSISLTSVLSSFGIEIERETIK